MNTFQYVFRTGFASPNPAATSNSVIVVVFFILAYFFLFCRLFARPFGLPKLTFLPIMRDYTSRETLFK